MSCYFRHIKDILDEAGITVTATNKKQVDRAIHQVAGVIYKDCPTTWKKLKLQILGDEPKRQAFIKQLKDTIRQYE